MENYSHCVKKPGGKYTVVPFSVPATEKETRTHRVWEGKRDPQTHRARGHRCPSGPEARPATSRHCGGGGCAGRPLARPGGVASHGVLQQQQPEASSHCPRPAQTQVVLTKPGGLHGDCSCLTEKEVGAVGTHLHNSRYIFGSERRSSVHSRFVH